MRHDFGLASLLSCLVLAGSQASATAMYVYQGENFTAIADDTPPSGTYTTDMAISGFIEIATPLAPDLLPTDITADVISFSFSDGRTTFTSSSPGVIFALDQVQTDLNGEIWAWDLRVSKGNALAPPYSSSSRYARPLLETPLSSRSAPAEPRPATRGRGSSRMVPLSTVGSSGRMGAGRSSPSPRARCSSQPA